MLWWRHQMKKFIALLAFCAGNSPVTDEFPTQRPVTQSFDVFFDLRLNKQLSKHSWGWWFETPSRPLWRHINVRKCQNVVRMLSCHQRSLIMHCHQGPVSISEKTSFRKISLSLEAARFVFRIVRSLWNLTGTSAAVLPMCLSNFKTIWQFKVPISWLRDFTRSYEKTSFRILRQGPGSHNNCDDKDKGDQYQIADGPSCKGQRSRFIVCYLNS